MALVDCDFFSESLEVGTSVTVVLPQETEAQIGVDATARTSAEMPVLYLLHGLSDDHTAWLRYTSIERYARRPASRSSCRRCTAASTPTSGTATPTGPTSPTSCPG